MKNLIFTVFFLVSFVALHSQIIYVTPQGAGLKNGTSWENALDGNFPSGNGFTKLAESIRTATSGKQFWIAEGTYKACSDNDREKSFELGQNIKLFGGFQGTESDTNQRNIAFHPTIFSGNIGQQNDSTDNSKIILKTTSIPWTTYSFINGIDFLNSFNSLTNTVGTGIYNTALIFVRNCSFKNNYSAFYGAGIYNERTLKVEKSLFFNNKAYSGGGLYNNWTNGYYPVPIAIITASTFSNNTASGGGGGIRNCGNLTLLNSLLVNNSSSSNAGGIYSMSNMSAQIIKIVNSTIANNSGGDVTIWGGKASVFNSVIWGNGFSLQNNPVADIRYSDIQGFTGNPLVYNSDPLFMNSTAGSGTAYNGLSGNWSFRWCSQFIDAGADSLVPSGITTDIDGNTRFRYAAVDLGAYEFDTTGIVRNIIGFENNRIYVTESNSYLGKGSSWTNAIAGNAESCKYTGQTLLYETMKDAAEGTQIWIKMGTYKCSLLNNRSHAFTIGSGVDVFGGFEGNENSLSERGNGTTLFSGEIGGQSVTTDNAYHVFNINQQGIGYSDTATLNRVVISSGYANGTTLASQGGGIIIGTGTKLKISNTAIRGNTASGNGGAVFIQPSSFVKIDSSSITDNSQIVTYSNSGFGNSAAGCGIFSQGKLIIQNSQVSRNANSSEGSGIYNTDSLFIANCHIDSNVTITYYAKAGGISNSKFCSISGSTVNYNDAKIRAGSLWNKAGAAMIINSSDVSHNAVLNTANGFGGGIVNEGTMTLANSSISNNSSPLDGGGIYNATNSQCVITNCTIAGNVSAGGWAAAGGGGIYNQGVLNIERSKVCNNQTNWNGGGIYNPTLVKNCLITNNSKGGQYYSGGGVQTGTGCLGIYNSTIMNNSGQGISSASANPIPVRNSILFGNDGQFSGPVTITNSCIEGTTLNNGNIFDNPRCVNPTIGKGIAYNGLIADWKLQSCSPSVNMGDNSFLSSSDTLDAGGNSRVKYTQVDMGAFELQTTPQEEVDYSAGIVHVSDLAELSGAGAAWNSALAGNAPSCRYPGYSLLYQVLRNAPANCQVWVKKGTYRAAVDADRAKSFLIQPKNKLIGGFYGNELDVNQRNINANPTVFSGNIGLPNDSTDNTKIIMIVDSITNGITDTTVIDGFVFSKAYSTGFAGGIKINANSKIQIVNSKFEKNIADEAAAIANYGKLKITNCDIQKNQSVSVVYNATGGTMDVHHSNIIYNKSNIGIFCSNRAVGFTNYGTAHINNCKINNQTYITIPYQLVGGFSNMGTATLDSCEISKNTMKHSNGAMFNSGMLIVTHCVIDSNTAWSSLGGILNTGNLDLLSCEISRNRGGFTEPGFTQAGGPGALINSGTCTIQDCHFVQNLSCGYGGAILNSGTLIVKNVFFEKNAVGAASYSSGWFNIVIIGYGFSGGAIFNSGNCDIDNSIFKENVATSGGAISNNSGNLSVNRSRFSENFAQIHGGAIYNNKKTSISNCIIGNNSSGYLTTYPNSIIGVGQGSYTSIRNTDIVNNGSSGFNIIETGKVWNSRDSVCQLKDTLVLSNTIFWNNNSGIGNNNNSKIDANYSCITGGWAGTGNMNTNPLFRNPSAGIGRTYNAIASDWTLSACSPGINTGADSLCADTTDLGGNPRKYQRIDMGAYELKYDSTILTIRHRNTARTSTTLYWKSAIKPCYTIVFIKDTVAGSPVPAPGIAYTTGSVYGSGSNLNGWYCIYQGLDTTVSVTNLVAGTSYRVAVFNYILNSHYDVPGLMNFNTEKTTLANITKTYGNSPFTIQATSFSGITAHSYAISPASVANMNHDTVSISNTGTATIKARHGGNPLYLSDSTQALLTVNKSPLDAIADNKTKIYGQINPPLTISYAGFVLNENSTVIDILPYAVTNATTLSNVGNYVIEATGGADNNYAINRINGQLVINKLIIHVNSNQSICNGASLAVGSNIYTATGIYIDTLYSTNIDTIVTTNLVANPVFAFNENHSICNGATYSWHGTTYNSTGTYTEAYTSMHGCDSIYTLHLSVNPVYAYSENHSICNGATYSWQGTTYNSTGTYTAAYTSMHGCDSIYTLHLTVYPVYAFIENHSICNGATYSWHGTSYNSAGTFNAAYTSMHGCDSIYTLHLTVYPVYAYTENHSICSGATYSWHGTTYNSTGIYTAAYTSMHGCDSIYTLHLSVNPVYAYSENHSICSGATYNWQGTSYNSAGTFTAAYTSIHGCDSIYTLHLTVNPVYAYSENHSICSGATYAWHGTNYNSAGTYAAVYTSIHGCDSIYTLHLSVNPVYAYTENHSICSGATYSWHGTSYNSAGTFTAAYTSMHGCDSIYTLNLTVNSVYAFSENHSICSGATFSWQGSTYNSAGTFTAAYTSMHGCDSIYTLNLTVNPVYAFTENHSICSGATYVWQGTNYNSAGNYTAAYTSMHGCDSIYTLNLTVNPVYAFSENHNICNGATYSWHGTTYNSAGTYTAAYTSIPGCDSIYTLQLTINPVYAFTENQNICSGAIYNWQGTDYSSSGTYIVNYSSIYSCDSSYTLNLTVSPVYSYTENHSICSGEIYTWHGTDYTNPGIFTAAYSTVSGCDSLFTLILTVSMVNTEVTVSGTTLSANTIADAYQWIDCDNGFTAIAGETNQSFTAGTNGNYAVIVSLGSCSDTSDCVNITTVNTEPGISRAIHIFPNPVSDELHIEIPGNTCKTDFEIVNALGQPLFRGHMTEYASVHTASFSPGVYLIKFVSGKMIVGRKFIKE